MPGSVEFGDAIFLLVSLAQVIGTGVTYCQLKVAGDGPELFYLNGEQMMVVDIATEPEFREARPSCLLKAVLTQAYDVWPSPMWQPMVKYS